MSSIITGNQKRRETMLKEGLKNLLIELRKNQKDETYKVKLNYEKALEELEELETIKPNNVLLDSFTPTKTKCPTCGNIL